MWGRERGFSSRDFVRFVLKNVSRPPHLRCWAAGSSHRAKIIRPFRGRFVSVGAREFPIWPFLGSWGAVCSPWPGHHWVRTRRYDTDARVGTAQHIAALGGFAPPPRFTRVDFITLRSQFAARPTRRGARQVFSRISIPTPSASACRGCTLPHGGNAVHTLLTLRLLV